MSSVVSGVGTFARALGTSHRIGFDQFYSDTGDYVAAGLNVFNGEGHRVHRYVVILSGEKTTILTHRHGLDNSDGTDPRLMEAILRWGLRRLEALLREDPPVWDVGINNTQWRIGEEDLGELVRLVREKTCDYQIGDGRDLLCSAAGAHDQTAIGSVAHRRVAPTSRSLCYGCRLPDTDFVCSHLIHPHIVGAGNPPFIQARRLAGALCDLGRAEVASPEKCKAAGHACWARVVEASAQAADGSVSPLTLPATLDHLDAVWRAEPWTSGRLFVHRHAETLAGLAQPCTSRADFRNRIDELDAVLKSMNVPIAAGAPDDGAGPLVRLKRLIAAKVAERGQDHADGDAAGRAVDDLLLINRLRTAMQHPTTASVDLTSAHAALGVRYPTNDWAEAWGSIQRRVVGALNVLIVGLDRLT